MDDLNIWWYLIAAVIYFITRAKKKKKGQDTSPRSQQPRPNSSRPGSENNPPPGQAPKTFEDLLKEITGEREVEPEPVRQEPMVIANEKTARELEEERRTEQRRLEGERRAFADEESRRVYEESIKQAEGSDLKFERHEHFKKLRATEVATDEDTYTFADEIRDGLSSSEARKAVIYAEILNRRF